MSASSFRGRWRYDVFVSFRGEDVRRKFVDHLFKDFKQKGIRAFRDDSELAKGEEISLEIYKAIEETRFLLVIFSKDYASSSWCLRELVKILECKQMGEFKHEVRIIFYDVKPDVVRKQRESYAEAFAKHESSNRTEVEEWKEALTRAANLSGWDLEDLTNGYEAKFINNISSEIFKKLCLGPLDVGENVVGVDAQVEELKKNLHFVGSDKVNMIGICGISGIGKTTLAKAIYNMLHVRFEGSCFCDVQEVLKREGLTGAQMQLVDDIMKTRDVKIYNVGQGIMVIKKMMSSKPILLVLDDVDHREQLEALAGSPAWFCPGSIIIFTCKDKKLLRSHHVHIIYDMPLLPFYKALELFCLHAFGQQHPTCDFKELTHQIVKHLHGHPLALKVLGGCLYKEPANIWKSQLDSLQTHPHADIQQKLRPSFDRLDRHHKRIFLDIACCFVGENKDFVVNVLNGNDYSVDVSINVLIDKSLITISPHDMSLQMHELIRSMAREIVHEECTMPGNRRRLLWGASEEVCDVLGENKETEAIEVLVLLLKKSSQKFHIDAKVFTHMKKLRILNICYLEQEYLGKLEDLNVNYSGSLDYLSNKLRMLYWHGCPFKFFPSNFYPENIVAIDLSYSHIKSLWTTPKRFSRLKIMKLKHCRNLISTPDFTKITNLEELILEGCVNLVNVHPSIGMLKSLVVLNLSKCFKVDTLPEVLGKIKGLVELHIHQTAITKLPSFVFSLSNLLILSFGRHESCWYRGLSAIAHPSFLPQSLVLSSLACFYSLRSLKLGGCNIVQVPENIGGLSCLEELHLNGNKFTSLPGSLSQLPRLNILHVCGCKNLKVFPELPPGIRRFYACYCNILQVSENVGGLSCLEVLHLKGNNFTSLPGSLSQLSHLRHLRLDDCKKLEVLRELPPSIVFLYASACNVLQVHDNIGGLSHLRYLYLQRNNFTSLPGSLSQLSRLDTLSLDGCKKLEMLPELPPTIRSLHVSNCNILQAPENSAGLSYLEELYFYNNNCNSLPQSLSQLGVSGRKKLEVLPELPPRTSYLYAGDCPKLVRNVKVESEEAQPLETRMTSHGSTNQVHSFFRYIAIRCNLYEFFQRQNRFSSMEMQFYGKRIPKWYINRSMRSEVKVELPRDWCYTKFMGYAVCVVFTPKRRKIDNKIEVRVKNFDGACLDLESVLIGRRKDESMAIHDSPKIWLHFRRKKPGGWEEAKNYVTFSFKGVKVKKCGVRIVWDEEDLQQEKDSSLINQYLSTATQEGGHFRWGGCLKTCLSCGRTL